jgi:hypothetical protein
MNSFWVDVDIVFKMEKPKSRRNKGIEIFSALI